MHRSSELYSEHRDPRANGTLSDWLSYHEKLLRSEVRREATETSGQRNERSRAETVPGVTSVQAKALARMKVEDNLGLHLKGIAIFKE